MEENKESINMVYYCMVCRRRHYSGRIYHAHKKYARKRLIKKKFIKLYFEK
jgi:cytochrome c oxidase assembly protein Cox11